MLTKHLVESPAILQKKRSARIEITNEGRALKELRLMHRLTMQKAGELIGVSDSYISHIENGRCDPPKDDRLEKFLAVYGGIKVKSFYERARNIRDQITPEQELIELVPKLGTDKVNLLLNLAKKL